MSLTVQDIVLEAKNLVAKLKERSSVTDNLNDDAKALDRRITSMNQHAAGDENDYDELMSIGPLSSYLGNIQQENCHLIDLQKENRELQEVLDDTQLALEIVMSKYREEVSSKIIDSKVDVTKFDNQESMQTILNQSLQISEMARIMEMAARADEVDLLKYDEELSRLTTENEGLRNLVQIATEFGSINSNKSDQSA